MVRKWLTNPKIRWALLAVAWGALLFTVGIPAWQGVEERNFEIGDLENRLATLDDWTVAGLWLAPAVKARTLPVNAAFSRLFPSQRGREELFLALARAADASGVEDFESSEANSLGMDGNDVWSVGAGATPASAPPPPGDETAMAGAMETAVTLDIPSVELSTYRIDAHFHGDYKRIARFMSGLGEIERALKVHSLVVRPREDGVQVDLELDVYVSLTSQS